MAAEGRLSPWHDRANCGIAEFSEVRIVDCGRVRGAVAESGIVLTHNGHRDYQTLQIRIEIENQPDEHDRRLIDEGLDIFNALKAGPDNAQDLWIMARANDGGLVGGLKGRTFYGWLFIDWLWVSPTARGQGVGVQLLAMAEHAAQKRQCIGAYVDTFSFQAPDFYRRNGYEEFGRIAELPPGHACIWLKKTFREMST